MSPSELKQELESKLQQIKEKIRVEQEQIAWLTGGLEALKRLNNHPIPGVESSPTIATPPPPVAAIAPEWSPPQPVAPKVHTTNYLAAKANRIANKGKV